jgi:hypothetical protein
MTGENVIVSGGPERGYCQFCCCCVVEVKAELVSLSSLYISVFILTQLYTVIPRKALSQDSRVPQCMLVCVFGLWGPRSPHQDSKTRNIWTSGDTYPVPRKMAILGILWLELGLG